MNAPVCPDCGAPADWQHLPSVCVGVLRARLAASEAAHAVTRSELAIERGRGEGLTEEGRRLLSAVDCAGTDRNNCRTSGGCRKHIDWTYEDGRAAREERDHEIARLESRVDELKQAAGADATAREKAERDADEARAILGEGIVSGGASMTLPEMARQVESMRKCWGEMAMRLDAELSLAIGALRTWLPAGRAAVKEAQRETDALADLLRNTDRLLWGHHAAHLVTWEGACPVCAPARIFIRINDALAARRRRP